MWNVLTLQEVLQTHRGLLGEQGTTAKIHVDAGTQPIFRRANEVPIALRADRLLSLGVIEPVEFSDWAAPIVPVVKPDGRICTYGDYKVTVNRTSKLDKYLIPSIDELFASLAGGKTFSKLDLSHAYLQITLSSELQQYVTVNTHKGDCSSIYSRE